MTSDFRKMTVVRHFSGKPTACLSLKGRWLEIAGFQIGTEVKVIVRHGCLVVLAQKSGVGDVKFGAVPE